MPLKVLFVALIFWIINDIKENKDLSLSQDFMTPVLKITEIYKVIVKRDGKKKTWESMFLSLSKSLFQ